MVEIDARTHGRLSRHLQRAVYLGGHGGEGRAAVGAQHDVGVEDGEQRVEVTVAGGSQERVDDLPLGVTSTSGVVGCPGRGGGPGWPAGGPPAGSGR